MSIGQKIKAARIAAGLDQYEFAQQLKNHDNALRVSNKTVSSWETDKSKPDIDDLNAIILVLGLSASYFFEQNEELTIEDMFKDKRLIPEAREFLEFVATLDSAHQNLAVSVARAATDSAIRNMPNKSEK